jgi:GPH family glycoside/pentoside/hexuronide:cation symporter
MTPDSSNTIGQTPNTGAVIAPASGSLSPLLIYGLGECAVSLVMNSIFAFAMLYYTKVLKLDPSWAGVAMSISVFWEAFAEPVMGLVSDQTRCRWGRRHPYMLAGGLLMAGCSYLIWAVPEAFHHTPLAIFWYLVALNLLLRTGLTLFYIPYMALGFELCPDYQGRARLQSIRVVFNMAANLAGPALAWSLFFEDQNGNRGTTVAANYLEMGTVFAVATAICVVLVVAGTFHQREDTRHLPRPTNGGRSGQFLYAMQRLLLDSNLRWVVVFALVTCLGTVWVSSLQMFVYDDFMSFSAQEKTFTHSSTMVGVVLGSLAAVPLTRRLDKKDTVLLGGLVSLGANGLLALLFLTGWVPAGMTWSVGGMNLPLALGLFVTLHATYWLGTGIALPVATAMAADVSEVNFLQAGAKQDGGYSAIFSLATRVAFALGLTTSGFFLHAVGYNSPPGGAAVTPDPAAVWRLGLVTFGAGALASVLGMLAIQRYPLTRQRLEAMHAARRVG